MKASVQRKINSNEPGADFTKQDVISMISIVCRSAEEAFGIREDHSLLKIRVSGTIGPFETDIRDFVLNTELFDTDEVVVRYAFRETEINFALSRNGEHILSMRSEDFGAIELLKAMEIIQDNIKNDFDREKFKEFELPPEEEPIEVIIKDHEQDSVVTNIVGKRRQSYRREEIRRRREEEAKRKKKKSIITGIAVGIALAVAAVIIFLILK